MESTTSVCKNNKMVTCSNPNGCSGCGWDETTKARRLLEIRRRWASSVSIRPCPFCGVTPQIQYRDDGATVCCENPECLQPTTGVRMDVETAIKLWNRRVHGGQIV